MRRLVHAFVCWYLRQCGRAFHHGAYETPSGCYVVLMSERQHNRYTRSGRALDRMAKLAEAADAAQCACSIRERDSGHLVGCWMPDLIEALESALESR